MGYKPSRVETGAQEEGISSPHPHDVLLGGVWTSTNHMGGIAFFMPLMGTKIHTAPVRISTSRFFRGPL